MAERKQSTEELVQVEVDLSSSWDGLFPLSLLSYSLSSAGLILFSGNTIHNDSTMMLAAQAEASVIGRPRCTPPHFIWSVHRRPEPFPGLHHWPSSVSTRSVKSTSSMLLSPQGFIWSGLSSPRLLRKFLWSLHLCSYASQLSGSSKVEKELVEVLLILY